MGSIEQKLKKRKKGEAADMNNLPISENEGLKLSIFIRATVGDSLVSLTLIGETLMGESATCVYTIARSSTCASWSVPRPSLYDDLNLHLDALVLLDFIVHLDYCLLSLLSGRGLCTLCSRPPSTFYIIRFGDCGHSLIFLFQNRTECLYHHRPLYLWL